MSEVSIIVPIYGVERFIGACAESLFAQTYRDLEYIFVDDCSPDASVSVLQATLERHPDRRHQVKVIRNAVNRGSGATRAVGLAAATANFVMYADSDDVLPTDAVALLMEKQRQTGADIVSGAYCRLLPDGSTSEAVLPFSGAKGDMLRLMLAQNTISHQVWGRLIRRSLHTEHQVDFIEGINMAEDYCIMPRLLFFASHAYINNVVYQYRDNATSTFYGWLSPSNIGSYLGASREVGAFLAKHDSRHDYAYAYELGMLNTIHRAMGFLPMADISRQCPYRPSLALFRLCRLMLCHRPMRPLLRITYLTLKRLYVTRHRP